MILLRSALLCLTIAGGASAASPTSPWPDDSLYHLDAQFETATGQTTTFVSGGGRVRIVTMFYASCPMACPLIIETLRGIERELSEAERAKLGVVVLSLDPENDSPAVLNEVAKTRRIDSRRWLLARTSPADTRKLAAALGVKYRQIGAADFDHSSVLVLIDAQGQVVARSTKMGEVTPDFIAAVRGALGGTSPLSPRHGSR
jgi:protein SCO1/2